MPAATNDWKLKLFYSVDLIGSSSYKAKKREVKDDVEWCRSFEDFYKDFPTNLTHQYKNLPNYLKKIEFKNSKIWKILGDEILFYSDITHHQQILVHIIALKNALIEYNNTLDKKKVDILRCKGTAWIAGFPANNIAIETKSQTSDIADFIGPSIDAGFRLTKFASKRKLIISIDALLMFSTAIRDIQTNDPNIVIENENPLRFDGNLELKGVYNNAPYPIFWLDMCPKNFEKEDKWLGKGKKCDYLEVITHSKEYINHNEYMTIPFIADSADNKFGEIPKEMENRKQKAISSRRMSSAEEDSDVHTEGSDVNPIKFDLKKTF